MTSRPAHDHQPAEDPRATPDPRATQFEHRLEDALRAVTPELDQPLVLRAVEQRRAALARRRRLRRAVGATSLVAACAAAVVLLVPDRSADLRTVGPAATAPEATAPTTLGSDGPWRWGPAVEVPGTGERLTALASDATGFWVARGGPGDGTTAPDTITRFGLDGSVGESTELQGTALLAAADEVSLWVLVEEPPRAATTGPLRLKHIDRADGRLVASYPMALPDPPIAIEVSTAEVVARSATRVIVFDRHGRDVRGPLFSETSDRRSVTVDELRWSTDGESGVRAEDLDGATTATIELPGLRRLSPASALGSGEAVAEVEHAGDVELVHLRLDGSEIRATPLGALDPSATVAAVGPGRVWVIRDGSLRPFSP